VLDDYLIWLVKTIGFGLINKNSIGMKFNL